MARAARVHADVRAHGGGDERAADHADVRPDVQRADLVLQPGERPARGGHGAAAGVGAPDAMAQGGSESARTRRAAVAGGRGAGRARSRGARRA